MSDYNVVISEVDAAMDMIESLIKELCDVRAHANFDVSSLITMVNRKINEHSLKLEELGDNIRKQSYEEDNADEETINKFCQTEDRLNRLLAIRSSCEDYGTELMEQLNVLCGSATEIANASLHEMGRYISSLNRIGTIEQTHRGNTTRNGRATYVCVVDSSRYPQTAEHIRVAQRMGFPSVLTIDRDNAADRRKASLEGVRVNRMYDRDEYPCAVFREGGSGADVVYVEGSDNRGAGSYMRWQMQNMPDGAQVRIRVV